MMNGNLNDLLKELPPDIARNVARFGVKVAIELLQTLYADLGGEAEAQPVKARAKMKRAYSTGKSGWLAFPTPEARSAEMVRRRAVAKAKRRSRAAKERWARKTKAEQQAHLRALERGKQHSKVAA